MRRKWLRVARYELRVERLGPGAIRDANTGWGDAISDPLGKITRRARRDGTRASDFAGLERMRRTSLPPAGVLHKLFWLCRILLFCNSQNQEGGLFYDKLDSWRTHHWCDRIYHCKNHGASAQGRELVRLLRMQRRRLLLQGEGLKNF